MADKLRVVELGRNLCPFLQGEHQYYLSYFTTLTATRCKAEPERAEEFEQQLLDFILSVAAYRTGKQTPIESRICWYYIGEMALKRRGNTFKMLEAIPGRGLPLWKLKLRVWFLGRDYKHTWFDRLKDCIALITVMHLLACLLIPDIREWTLDIIVRCNQDYFSRFAELLEPASRVKAELIRLLTLR